jgi:Fe2+ or Zn2+ uptake regulation protein
MSIMARYKVDPYLLSNEEKLVLDKVRIYHTPLLLSKATTLPRSTVYFLLEKLKRRGFVREILNGKKKKWILNSKVNTDDEIISSKSVKVYRTSKEIENFLTEIIVDGKERIKSLSGGNISEGWRRNVGNKRMIKFNNLIKEHGLISELTTSKNFFDDQFNKLGKNWAESFSNRPCEFHILPDKYANHSGQIFMKENSIYFIDMSVPIVIEISNPNITRMILDIFSFIKDNTDSTDVNELIRKVVGKV